MENGVGKFYGEDGSVAEVINHDGWNLVNGIYYYLEAGTLLKGTDRYWENGQEKKAGTYKLSDGNWYVFDEEGRMLNNVMIFDRWYGEYGAAMTGWIYQAGNWYYADPEKRSNFVLSAYRTCTERGRLQGKFPAGAQLYPACVWLPKHPTHHRQAY